MIPSPSRELAKVASYISLSLRNLRLLASVVSAAKQAKGDRPKGNHTE